MFNKNRNYLVLFTVVFLVITACTPKDPTEAMYRKISPEAAKEMMVEGNIILDVRTEQEYESGHIEGALLLPVNAILSNQLELLPDKEQKILVYCRSGNRSQVASKYLVEKGYTQVYDFGGIIDWPYEKKN